MDTIFNPFFIPVLVSLIFGGYLFIHAIAEDAQEIADRKKNGQSIWQFGFLAKAYYNVFLKKQGV